MLSEEELEEIIERERKFCVYDSYQPSHMRGILNWNRRVQGLVAHIEAQAKEIERLKQSKKWISVEDRFPETNDLQLIGYTVKIAPDLIIGLARYDQESKQWYGHEERFEYEIRYWAETPEPPETDAKGSPIEDNQKKVSDTDKSSSEDCGDCGGLVPYDA